MVRAPLAVRIACGAYAATPLVLLALAQSDVPSLLTLAPIAITLAAGPIVAWGLWRVRRWAFWALPVHTLFLVAVGLVDISFYPEHGLPLGAAVLAPLVLGALISRKAVRVPFLAQDGRGFRRARRHSVDLPSHFICGDVSHDARTIDLSRGGAYLACTTRGLTAGDRGWLVMTMREHEWRSQARIASVNPEGTGLKPEGVGLELTNLKTTDFENIDAFIALGRRYQRCEVTLPIRLQTSAETLSTETINLSLGGSFVRGGADRFHPGDRIMISLSIEEGETLDCIAEVAWASAEERDTLHSGLALQFIDLGKQETRQLRRRLAQLGAEKTD